MGLPSSILETKEDIRLTDEITSIKNTIALGVSQMQTSIECIEKSNKFNQETRKRTLVQRRQQSLQDSFKFFQTKY